MSSSRIVVELVGFDPPPAGGFTGGVTCSNKYSKRGLANGGGTDQLDSVVCYKTQLAASGTLAIDFGTDLDRYGVALAAVDVAAGIVQNVGPETGQLRMEVPVPGSDGWRSFLDTVGGTEVAVAKCPTPGTGFAFWGLTSGDYPVGAGNDSITLAEYGTANPVDLEAQFWIRK